MTNSILGSIIIRAQERNPNTDSGSRPPIIMHPCSHLNENVAQKQTRTTDSRGETVARTRIVLVEVFTQALTRGGSFAVVGRHESSAAVARLPRTVLPSPCFAV